jgi:hypothetical protein
MPSEVHDTTRTGAGEPSRDAPAFASGRLWTAASLRLPQRATAGGSAAKQHHAAQLELPLGFGPFGMPKAGNQPHQVLPVAARPNPDRRGREDEGAPKPTLPRCRRQVEPQDDPIRQSKCSRSPAATSLSLTGRTLISSDRKAQERASLEPCRQPPGLGQSGPVPAECAYCCAPTSPGANRCTERRAARRNHPECLGIGGDGGRFGHHVQNARSDGADRRVYLEALAAPIVAGRFARSWGTRSNGFKMLTLLAVLAVLTSV